MHFTFESLEVQLEGLSRVLTFPHLCDRSSGAKANRKLEEATQKGKTIYQVFKMGDMMAVIAMISWSRPLWTDPQSEYTTLLQR